MLVSSNWKITFNPSGTPLVVCTWGQRIADEPSWPWSQMVQEGPRIRGVTSRFFARGNSTGGLTLASLTDHANDAAARAHCLGMQITLDAVTLLAAPLKVEIFGGAVYQAASAVIRSGETRMVIGAPKARTRTDWRIEATGWALVPPPPP